MINNIFNTANLQNNEVSKVRQTRIYFYVLILIFTVSGLTIGYHKRKTIENP
ncbi:MAG: hypothetical protein IPF54_11350 [Draconibacterium sp.]|nr:hypothetical protein [Draconibacterium sp.]